jgi:sec-independent protein translocase protein TatB
MFDISWTEFLLIGVVALIFIGPKELPAVLRTVGQWTRRIRSMAADFQGQFQEAMREAEMADLKKQVDDIAHDVKNYDPLKEVRTGVEAAGKDIQSSLEKPVATPSEADTTPAGEAIPAVEQTTAEIPALPEAAEHGNGAALELAPPPPAETTALPAAPDFVHEPAAVADAVGPVVPEAVESAEKPDAGHRE